MPDQTQDVDTDSPGFDPGGDTELPFDAGPPAEPEDVAPDAAPLEIEPTDDPEGRAAPFVEPEAPGTPDEAPVRPLEGTPPNAPPAPGLSTEPPVDDGVTPESAPAPLPPEQGLLAEPSSGARRKPGLTAVIRVKPSRSGYVETSVDSGAPSETMSSGGAGPAQTTDLTRPVAVRSRATDKARVHVVQPGESLWTIAENFSAPAPPRRISPPRWRGYGSSTASGSQVAIRISSRSASSSDCAERHVRFSGG